MSTMDDNAPGQPGIPPRWTSSAKSGVGTALGGFSRVWFTLSHGIVDEVYYPRVDLAAIRDLGLIVTDGLGFFSEEKRNTRHRLNYLADGVPGYTLINECDQGRYRIEKELLTDPVRHVLLQRVRFVPLQGGLGDYQLHALLAPHLGNFGYGNTAWVGDYKGTPMLFAQRDGSALALACSVPWLKRSAGFVGVSDGWQDLHLHGQMLWSYQRAENGNVALTGQVDLGDAQGEFLLALGFGRHASEAANRAVASLQEGFDSARRVYVTQWEEWHRQLLPVEEGGLRQRDLYRISTTILRAHESKDFQGGIIASLSVPWGFSKGDDDLGGYHLVWPRDLAESAGALLAAGARADVRRTLAYLQSTQEADGRWPQNMWLDGSPYWEGNQMDETAFPILLLNMAHLEDVLSDAELARYWPMVRAAAGFIVRNGPVTQQDRWEEDPGYSPFTLAVEIAALLVAAEMADSNGEAAIGSYLRETADLWNSGIERWSYATGTDLAQKIGVEGYYVRLAPPEEVDSSALSQELVLIKNRPVADGTDVAAHVVSPDALALVRFGLRAADDPRILNTIKVVDALLKVETPFGPIWHRYDGDGYGEHADGSPFDGTGIGRAWPLLTGERAHYELAAGHYEVAEQLLGALESFANEGGMISEQVWDAPDIPERELYYGRPSGSAMPLVWAHAEYVKLRRSLHDRKVFDTPPQTVQRYVVDKIGSPFALWRFNHRLLRMPAGKRLRLDLLSPTTVHWSADGWRTVTDTATRPSGLGTHLVDLPTDVLPAGAVVTFTFYWPESDRWEGVDFEVRVAEREEQLPPVGGQNMPLQDTRAI